MRLDQPTFSAAVYLPLQRSPDAHSSVPVTGKYSLLLSMEEYVTYFHDAVFRFIWDYSFVKMNDRKNTKSGMTGPRGW